MTKAIDKANDAHKVWQARLNILRSLHDRLRKIDAELDDIDRHARANQGQVAHPPQAARAAEDVMLDKAATQSAIAVAEIHANEAEADFESNNTHVR